MTKDLAYYMKLPYKVVITPPENEDDDWYAYIPTFSSDTTSCTTQAETWEESKQQISDAKETYLMFALEDGMKIPEPKTEPVV
jgi:antitoxin HicB